MLAFIKYLGEGGLALLLIAQLFVATGYVMDKAVKFWKFYRGYNNLVKLNKLQAMQIDQMNIAMAELIAEVNELQQDKQWYQQVAEDARGTYTRQYGC
jgi:hypothetical protein